MCLSVLCGAAMAGTGSVTNARLQGRLLDIFKRVASKSTGDWRLRCFETASFLPVTTVTVHEADCGHGTTGVGFQCVRCEILLCFRCCRNDPKCICDTDQEVMSRRLRCRHSTKKTDGKNSTAGRSKKRTSDTCAQVRRRACSMIVCVYGDRLLVSLL